MKRIIAIVLFVSLAGGLQAQEYYAQSYKQKARMYAVVVSFHWTMSFYKNK